jgi:uncharacterized membrane protein YgcG
VLPKGRAASLATTAFNTKHTSGLATVLDEFITLVNENVAPAPTGAASAPQAAPQHKSSGFPWWGWVLVFLAVSLIIALIVGLYLSHKHAKEEEDRADRYAFNDTTGRRSSEEKGRDVEPGTVYQAEPKKKGEKDAGVADRVDASYAGARWYPGGYCVAPNTLVLTADLRWIPAAEVKAGMDLLGFDEEVPVLSGTTAHANPRQVRGRRRWRRSTVEVARVITRPSYRLTFDDGTEVVCSAEHQWLVGYGESRYWLETERIEVDVARHRVVKVLEPWQEDRSWDAAYLAAAFDGEGFFSIKGGRGELGFAQKSNEMLDEVTRCLDGLGIPFAEEGGHNGVWHIRIRNRKDALRILGSVRPRRLLTKVDPDQLGTIDPSMGVGLVAKEFLGEQEVVAMETSTGTFVANGLASHNCNNMFYGPGYYPGGFLNDFLWIELMTGGFDHDRDDYDHGDHHEDHSGDGGQGGGQDFAPAAQPASDGGDWSSSGDSGTSGGGGDFGGYDSGGGGYDSGGGGGGDWGGGGGDSGGGGGGGDF